MSKENKLIRIELKLKHRNPLIAIVMKKGVKKHKNKKKDILSKLTEKE
jgi:hypothetical protein